MTIDTEILENVKYIVVHGGCPDGMASAIILAQAIPSAEIIFGIYGKTEYEKLGAEKGMLFCDIIPPIKRTDEFVKVDAIVLDHHKHAKDTIKKYKYHDFADEVENAGVSGALLAYWNAYIPLLGENSEVEHFAILAGIRDTWQKDSKYWVDACIQAETLKFYPEDYWLEDPDLLITEDEDKVGEIVYQKRIESVKRNAPECYIYSVNKYKVAIFNTRDSSDLSDYLRDNFDVNICIGFTYYCFDNKTYIGYSCRSDGSFDVGAFAKHFDSNGGGHSKAAGFRKDVDLKDYNPYFSTMTMISKYLDRKLDNET